MVYSFAAMVVEPKRSDAGVSGRLLQSIIQLLDANGMAVILDRDIAPDAPNELTMSFKDAPKVLRLAVEVIRASVFFRISWREARALVHDLLRIQREPGWGTLESVHREAGCRGQQLGNLVRVLCQMGVGHKVVDFGSSWLLIIWKQGLQG